MDTGRGDAGREPFNGVVLAGGAGTRLGTPSGRPKAEVLVDGVAMLDRVCQALDAAERVIVVGGRRAPGAAMLVVEDPPGGGPVAALAAALALVDTPVLVVLAADLPLVDVQVVSWLRAELAAAGTGCDAVVPLDAAGRPQPLAAAYRTSPLAAALAVAPAAGRSMRSVLSGLEASAVVFPQWAKLADVDTPEDLTAARVQAWATRLAVDLKLPLDPGAVASAVPMVLDIARDAAHQVARPAAPVTTFLAGVAVGSRVAGGATTDEALADVAQVIAAALAESTEPDLHMG